VQTVERQAGRKNATDDGMGSKTLPATSTSIDNQSSSGLFSPNGTNSSSHASPKNTPNGAASGSPRQTESQSLSCIEVSESKKNRSKSAHKMTLEDYRCRQSDLTVMTMDCRSKATVAPNHRENKRFDEDSAPSEYMEENVTSLNLSNSKKSGVKPRIKLKIGSEVVAKTVSSPKKQSCDVYMPNKVGNVTCNGSSLPEKCSNNVLKDFANEETSEKLNLLNAYSSAESSGHACNGSSCEDSSDSEPPSKHARMSSKLQFPSIEESACRWIHHD